MSYTADRRSGHPGNHPRLRRWPGQRRQRSTRRDPGLDRQHLADKLPGEAGVLIEQARERNLQPLVSQLGADGHVLRRVDTVEEDKEAAGDHECAKDEKGDRPLREAAVTSVGPGASIAATRAADI
eukprot:scaffold193229_cov31-Tisochrysis_lutea.AAC.2